MRTYKARRYLFASFMLLAVFASHWYVKTTWIGHAASRADDRINVAAAANGGAASASSTKDGDFPAAAVIDGDRKGLGWGAGSGWADGTPSVFPDFLEIEFNDPTLLDEVDVITIQDTWWNPIEPTETMNFFNNGVTAFEVQYFNGVTWLTIPGAMVTGNTKVWRTVTFAPVTTQKIRLKVNAAKSLNSILIEVEAYGVPATSPDPTPTPTPVPGDNLTEALALHDIFIDSNNHIGFGTQNPIFNDDGTTGAFVGKWVAIDGKVSGAAAYLGLGGITGPNERVGSLNFYNHAMGGADHRTASIFSFNGPTLGTGNLEFYTAPNFIGPVRRVQIAPTGEIGINHAAGPGTILQVMGQTSNSAGHALGVLNSSDRPLLTVRNDGQVSVGQPGEGIVLKSPNGLVCRKLTIDDNGNLVVKPMASCP